MQTETDRDRQRQTETVRQTKTRRGERRKETDTDRPGDRCDAGQTQLVVRGEVGGQLIAARLVTVIAIA